MKEFKNSLFNSLNLFFIDSKDIEFSKIYPSKRFVLFCFILGP